MTNITKNQHYVPQCYIKRFACDGHLSVYFKEGREIKQHQNPKNFASKRFYYDTNRKELEDILQEIVNIAPDNKNHIDWEDTQFIEHYLSREESDIVTVMNAIEANPQMVNDSSNMAKIIIFIHDMMYRNFAYRKVNDEINQVTYDHLKRLDHGKGEQWVESNYGAGTARKQQLRHLTSLKSLLKTNEILTQDYDCFFAKSITDAKFLISDNPVPILFEGMAEFCLPLSMNNALIFRKKNVISPLMIDDQLEAQIINISTKSICKLNLIQFAYAEKYVFGDYKNLVAMKKLVAGFKCFD